MIPSNQEPANPRALQIGKSFGLAKQLQLRLERIGIKARALSEVDPEAGHRYSEAKIASFVVLVVGDRTEMNAKRTAISQVEPSLGTKLGPGDELGPWHFTRSCAGFLWSNYGCGSFGRRKRRRRAARVGADPSRA